MSPGRVASPTLTSEAGALPRHRLWPARGGENSARGPAVPSPSAGGRPQGRWRWGCYSRVILQSSSLGLAGSSPLCLPMPSAASGEHPGGIVVGEPSTNATAARGSRFPRAVCSPSCVRPSWPPEPRASQRSCWLSPELVVRDPPMVFVHGLGGGEEVVFLKESECTCCIARTLF